jgi:hypothetical protein
VLSHAEGRWFDPSRARSGAAIEAFYIALPEFELVQLQAT